MLFIIHSSGFRLSVYGRIHELVTGVEIPAMQLEASWFYYFGSSEGESRDDDDGIQTVPRQNYKIRGYDKNLMPLRFSNQDTNGKAISTKASDIRRRAQMIRLKQADLDARLRNESVVEEMPYYQIMVNMMLLLVHCLRVTIYTS